MSVDFENKPLKDENGEIIRYANGKPVLYKHFLNDLPDEEHEVFSNLSDAERVAEYRRRGFPVPENLLKSVNDVSKDGNTENQ